MVHVGEKYGIDGNGIHALIPQIANDVPTYVNQIFVVDQHAGRVITNVGNAAGCA